MSAITKLIADANKKYGENSLMVASDIPVYPSVHTGSLHLDFALGIGGWPQDRVVEVSGEEGCGKTTLGILSMVQFLTAFPDRYAMILDLEHKLTKDWVEFLVGEELWNSGRILYAQPDHFEQATNMYVDLVGTGEVCFTMLDSIGGAATKAVMEKDAEKAQVGGLAQPATKFMKLAATYSAKYRSFTYCTNQVREDMEGFRRHMTPGGRGPKHSFIARVKLKRSTQDKKIVRLGGEDIQIGYKIHATVIKNQLAAPFRTAEYWFYNVPTPEYGFGIDTTEECVRLGVATGVIQGSGWYRHPAFPEDDKGERRVQGLPRVLELVRADATVRQAIVTDTMASLENNRSLLASISPIDAKAASEAEPEEE